MNYLLRGLLTVVAFVGIVLCASAQRIIENPDFECSKSHSLTIERVTFGPEETRLDCYVRSKRGSKVTVEKKTILRDNATGAEYLPTRAEGATLGKGIKIPAEGFIRFSLFYPNIPASVKSVDLIEGGWDIFGLRLDGKKATKPVRMTNPSALTTKTDHPATIPSLFKGGKTVIEGRIDGFDKRIGGDNLQMRSFVNTTGEDVMHAIPINSDGSFRYEFEIAGPSFAMVMLGRVLAFPDLYVEPGRNLNIYIDIDQALENATTGDDSTPYVHFGGSLGQINEEIAKAPQTPLIRTDKYGGSIPPSRAMVLIDSIHAVHRSDVDKYIATNPSLHPVTRTLLGTDTLCRRAYDHLNFAMYCRRPAGNKEVDPTMPQITTDYYRDFMPALMTADSTIILCSYTHTLLNRLAFCSLPELLGFDSENLELSNKYVKNGPNMLISSCTQIDDKTRRINEFIGVTETPLLWQLTTNAMLCNFNRSQVNGTEEQGMAVLDSFRTVTHPDLHAGLKKYFKGRYDMAPKPLPDDENGQLMSSIIAPYKGKAIVIDLWSTGCGPCRAGIKKWKEFRDKNRGHKGFMFLFITNEDESPQKAYDNFVAENLSEDISLRLPISDFNRLRTLFNFSAIPRYVLITPDGRVADAEFSLNEKTLSRRLAEIGVVL